MIINRISILRRLRLELQATLQRASRVRALPLIKVERLVARQQRKHILQTRNVAFTSTPTGRRVHAEPGLAGGFRHDCTVVAASLDVFSAIARRRRRRRRARNACAQPTEVRLYRRADVNARAHVGVTAHAWVSVTLARRDARGYRRRRGTRRSPGARDELCGTLARAQHNICTSAIEYC
jgi:hypothetical protein